MAANPVSDALSDPAQLERLYENDPESFAAYLKQALEIQPDLPLLGFWRVRLEHAESKKRNRARVSFSEISALIIICLLATLAIRLPMIFGVDREWLMPRFLPFVVFCGLITYFVRPHPQLNRENLMIGTGGLMMALPLLLLPHNWESSTVVMAVVHAPLVMWILLGLAFTRNRWQQTQARLAFIRANGEVFIYTVLILLGGVVFSGLTVGLFSLIGADIAEWYANNIALAGIVSAPLVATFLYDQFMGRNSRIATTIANLFTPLFLIMTVIYLLVMAALQMSPFTDREFLIVINGLLLIVLGMTVYSVCGRNHDSPAPLIDGVNICLIGVTLVINVIALSAILYRFSEWGVSPNRIVAAGANILIFTHLLQLLRSYVAVIRRGQSARRLERAAVGFFPIYGAWASIVVLALPLVFSFA